MHAKFFAVAVAFAFSGICSALPADSKIPPTAQLYDFLSKRVVTSPDNTCGNAYNGNNNSYSCSATSNIGGCCSQYGYCGNTTDYCGIGCQSAFGTCASVTTQPIGNSVCGPANSGISCGTLCCSSAGYCGNTTDYCGTGCQSGYGTCNSNSAAPSSGGTCGPNFGSTTCANGQCCSMSGYCGNSSDYCADPGNCMLGYGRCDSDATPAGPSTINVPRPLKGPVTYTTDILDCVENNVVALSFDDGPYNYTSNLLDILLSYGFHATFFITGNNNGKGEIDLTAPYPDLIKRMIAEGHQVASHTWSHYSLSNCSHDLRIAQMVKNEMAFNNIIGMWPTYMRPPYSDCTQASGCWADMLSLGYHRVYFDLDTQDYLNPLPTQIQTSKNIVQAALAVPGVTDYLSIQHDIVQQSVANLSSFYFDIIKAKGWKGVPVAECLGDTTTSNWYRSFGTATSSTPTSTIQATVTPTSTRQATATPTTTVQAIVTPTTTRQATVTPTTTTQTIVTPTTTIPAIAKPTTTIQATVTPTTTSSSKPPPLPTTTAPTSPPATTPPSA